MSETLETKFIGVVCGLRSEEQVIRQACDGPRIRIGVSGANTAKAEEIARQFCQDGAAAIISLGVSGGLDPKLRPGALLVGGEITDAAGGDYATSMLLTATAQAAFGFGAATFARLYGSDEIIMSAEEKASIFKKTSALAVDMESHAVARAAEAFDVPFLAVRAIADPAMRALPKAALNAVAPDGSTRVLPVLGAALRDPQQFPALIKLGGDSAAAIKTLRRSLGGLFPALFRGLDF